MLWYWQRLKKYFFRNNTFLFFKIESQNFQHLFEIEFCETSQNFNSFSLFRQLLFSSFFYQLSDWAEILEGFMKFNFKMNVKVSAFYLEKQKSFISKKYFLSCTTKVHPKGGVSRLNFPEGFGKHDWNNSFCKSTKQWICTFSVT